MTTTSYGITRWLNGRREDERLAIIDEEPLAIRVQGKPYAVVMRTPGDDTAHAAGFCLTEGLIDTPEDIVNLAACDGTDSNVVTVTLTPQRQRMIAGHLDRRGYVSQTSCGLCGKTLIDEIMQALQPVSDATTVHPTAAERCLRDLHTLQPLRALSRAAHAAALFDKDLQLLSVAEDVGRHNALDKAVGRLFLDGRLHLAKAVVMSSRISYELVQKSVRARLPVFLALSRPTTLAMNLADRLNVTLAGAMKPMGLLLYTHAWRLWDDSMSSGTQNQ
ncbi:MAG: formate dehydrogenase accessory sulfurtransferase FdhD [Desulfatitalea sp.]|nr:formate dehydrogenase accessory sulfurtransferase FdhD [Desulfatitalea sp.]NNK01456.1 formate dehydrogenase accessory sulfurtransferase FdhD [Desulfatitalea sp.]